MSSGARVRACSLRGKKHLTLRGAGATLLMHKDDYHRPPYELAEWRHALSIRGCEDVTIEGITLRESGGDGIYLGVGSENATNRDITIRNVICDGNNRQGISVITAENLLIEGCVLRQTRGTAPQAGIDFEPNRPEERLVNCVLRNCRSEYNAGHAYHIYLGFMHHGSTLFRSVLKVAHRRNVDDIRPTSVWPIEMVNQLFAGRLSTPVAALKQT